MPPTSDQDQRLDSWKAIARHLGRSVRTVRRWEESESLPIHRLMHGNQGSVYAFANELDAWWEQRRKGPENSLPTHVATAQGSGTAKGEPLASSIAVLPFRFSGPEASQQWVAQGLAEEIIGSFSRLANIRVISRTSSATFENTDKPSSSIAKALGVAWLLEGSVIGDGESLRINVRLVDGKRDELRWSERFRGGISDVFEIQEQIAKAVVDALQVQLKPAEAKQLGAHATADISAWRRIILARQAAVRWHKEALDQARTLLEEALSITGENAVICASIGRVLLNYREAGIITDFDPVEAARKWQDRAASADPMHPETQILEAWLAYADADLIHAIQFLEKALEFDRDHPDGLGLLVNCLLLTGQVDRARPVIAHLSAVDPVTPLTKCMPGFADAMEGDFESALGPYQDMLEADPKNPIARLFCIWIELTAGKLREATELASEFEHTSADFIPSGISQFLITAAIESEVDVQLPEQIAAVAQGNEMLARFIAEGYARRGDAEATASWLNIAVDRGFANWPYLSTHSPVFSAMIGAPELSAVANKAKQNWAAALEASQS